MADVTVDAKPMAKLPYDPGDIPDAVKKRVAAVEALYTPNGPQQPAPPPAEPVSTAPGSGPTPEPPQPPAQEAPAPAAPAESSLPAPPAPAEPPKPRSPEPEDENSGTWKSRYMGLQGRFTAAQKTIGEMQEQMTQLGNELLQTQRYVQQSPRQPAPPPQSYLTEQDEQNYGRDLIDFTQRAAAQALTPHLQQIEQQNAELRERLAREARRGLDQAVEMAVPNYREIDRDPLWHRWLLGVDVLSGRVRQQLLNEAIASASAPRVISFFKGFQQEAIATGHAEPAPSYPQATAPPREPAIPLASLAAPGRARPATGGDASVPSEKPIYSRAQIAQLYSAHRKGAYVGREAEWARQDADIIAAGREGRIR